MDGSEDDAAPRRYHHGDLRSVLLAEGEALLEERGPAGFSLRALAKRAGVSHAAPAHHFGDAGGLMTALAARGYERLAEAQAARRAEAGRDPLERLAAGGLGYVEMARRHPALFDLLLDARRLDWKDEALCRATDAAFAQLEADTALLRGRDVSEEERAETLRIACSVAHGAASLLNAGRLAALGALPPAEQDEAILAMFRRALR